MKLNNFSAGPSKIPVQVIRTIAEEINNYKDLGYSVLEISHRSNVFEDIVNSAKSKLVRILEIPDNYDIFFLQGGATFQNTFIPTNKRSLNNNISFLISGTWGRKTHKDFETYFDNEISNFSINEIGFQNIDNYINELDEQFLYMTSNETIEGIQIRDFDVFKNKKLIIDMSSDICSYKFDWTNLSYVYAGAQKNLGIPGVTICIVKKGFVEDSNQTSYLNINNHISKNSSFNTPPTFSIYVLLKILDWILDSGGINEIQKNNFMRASRVYDFLDSNKEHFNLKAAKDLRSYSNIVFDFKDSSKTEEFLNNCIKCGFIGLNGHRSVGGVRVSNYNSITDEMVSDFLTVLNDFVSQNDS